MQTCETGSLLGGWLLLDVPIGAGYCNRPGDTLHLWVAMRVCSAAVDILFVTPAISPYHPGTEVGDVTRALAKALRGTGHRVTVVSPLYAGADPGAHALGRKLRTLDVEVGGETRDCVLYTGRTTGGVELAFISHDGTFGEAPASDDSPAARAATVLLARAAALYAETMEHPPEVIHAFGPQAALAGSVCRAEGITCGNVLSLQVGGPQGVVAPNELAGLGLPDAVATELDKAGSIVAYARASADRTVVDSQAALDAVGPAGEGQPEPVAIANAVDASVWNPLTDAHLEARFDPANTDGKQRCKTALQYAAELPVQAETPVVGVVGAGADALLAAVAERLLRNDVQVVLGVDGGQASDTLAAAIEQHGERVKVIDSATEQAVHQLVAGSDLLLMSPECCAGGTLHLCAQRYGTPPIVIDGSLAAELVVDCDTELRTGSGFTYADGDALAGTLGRALSAYAETRAFAAFRQRVMRIDTSWDRAARRYEHVYRSALPAQAEAS